MAEGKEKYSSLKGRYLLLAPCDTILRFHLCEPEYKAGVCLLSKVYDRSPLGRFSQFEALYFVPGQFFHKLRTQLVLIPWNWVSICLIASSSFHATTYV